MIEFHLLPCWDKKEYPEPEITIADNHPVYINGIKLINGRPLITDNHKDSSRLEEFISAGFSKLYIQWLTDSEIMHKYTSSKGKPCGSKQSEPFKPSYSKIGNETILPDPDNYLVKHKVEIVDYQVLFNGYPIARAPEYFKRMNKSRSQWTPARRLQFCKAVIWGIDPSYQGYVTKRVKNSNGQMEDQSFPDDLYFRELIAKYPALIDNQIEDVKEEMRDKIAIAALPGIIAAIPDLVLPEHLNAYTHEAITGYQEVKDTRDYGLNRVEMADLIEMNGDDYEKESGNDYHEYDNVMTEFNLPAISEMWQSINPAANIIRSWSMPHLRVSITEECLV